MSERIMFNCTHGKDDPERATLPFIAANVALTAGLNPVVVCTVDAVWSGTVGGRDGIAAHELPTLEDIYTEYTGAGGEVWLCGACTKPRNITEDKLDKGAAIVGAARIIEEIAQGAKPVNFAG